MSSKLLFYPIVIVATWLVRNNPFFWDTVQLASKHAHFFYETDFQSLILPREIDSGHPPLFGMYLAAAWQLFGKTVAVSHFAMLPFLLGIVFFLQKIGEKLLGKRNAIWLMLLCFADPVLLGQAVLISPDVVLVCCFLMSLWAIWSGKSALLGLGIIGVGLVSMRGMMLGVALFFFSLFCSNEKIGFSLFFKRLIPFLPGGLLAGGYLFYHWQQTGWIGYHADSTWAPSFERVDFQGFVRNCAVLVWRFLDFGRVILWVVLALFSFALFKANSWRLPKIDRHQPISQLVVLTLLVFLVLTPSQILYKGLLAHRYFLPLFLSLNLLAGYLLVNKSALIFNGKWMKLAVLGTCFGLTTGNFWVYPPKISMGWDSTLAHLPWYQLQNQVQEHLHQAGIPLHEVGTAFPSIGPREIHELNGIEDGFAEKDLSKNCLVFYSNIMNDFTDSEIDALNKNWDKAFERKSGGVRVVLYKNRNQRLCEN